MTICILGMHRSGTSCVAGTLQAAGLFLGDVSTAEKHNLKGNRENAAIMALHDDLFVVNGGSWRDPPATVRWLRHHRARRDAIIAELSENQPRWGFKDPCALFLLDGWLEVLSAPKLVGVVRHPQAVARSLQQRRGRPLPGAFALWTRYNQRMAAYRDRFDVPIVCFDAPARELIASSRELCVRLGLDPAGADAFFDANLRHHDGAVESWDGVPETARALYEELTGRS